MDHYKSPSLNHFTARGVDRVTRNRRDDEWLAGRLQDEHTRFIPVWRSKNLFAAGQISEPVFLRPHEMQDLVGTAGSTVVLLGVDGNRAHFAIDVSSEEEEAPPAALAALGQFRDLRRVAALLDEQHCALLAYAKGIISTGITVIASAEIAAVRRPASTGVTCGLAPTRRVGGSTSRG